MKATKIRWTATVGMWLESTGPKPSRAKVVAVDRERNTIRIEHERYGGGVTELPLWMVEGNQTGWRPSP